MGFNRIAKIAIGIYARHKSTIVNQIGEGSKIILTIPPIINQIPIAKAKRILLFAAK